MCDVYSFKIKRVYLYIYIYIYVITIFVNMYIQIYFENISIYIYVYIYISFFFSTIQHKTTQCNKYDTIQVTEHLNMNRIENNVSNVLLL